MNRDLSWLAFNRRVLHEALDERNPLLERVRFLAICISNLDEFFMKRVGWHRRQARLNPGVAVTADGRTSPQTLREVRRIVSEAVVEQAGCLQEKLKPALRAAGVELCSMGELTETERAFVDDYFDRSVFPVLTPLAVDPGSPFPFISNLSLSLGVMLGHPQREEPVFARVKVPEVLPGWVRVDGGAEAVAARVPAPGVGGPIRLVPMHALITAHLPKLFAELTVQSVTVFRVTRNAEVPREDEEDSEDLRELMEEELRARRFADVVRLETSVDPDPAMLAYLKEEFEVSDDDVYELPAGGELVNLRGVADLSWPGAAGLKFEPWTPVVPAALADPATDIFAVIRRGDLMVHHPYESFEATVGRFVEAAAADPKVLAIKMTLYRVGDSTGFIQSLIKAAERGKQVVVLVELKARFDEERNLRLADELERAGAHVLYGVVNLKTHTKVTLVVRDETEAALPAGASAATGIRSYAHIGTGNYNSTTARLYSDVSLFTCDPNLTRDVVELFHFITGRTLQRTYRKLLVAPVNMRERVIEMIGREAAHALAGRPARIVAKMNQLEDRKVCNALYEASAAGVRIELIVRGFCTLRPGVAGLSENIRVMSVVGRFLEHSRIFHFANGQADPLDGEFYIGSADWMYRNLQARIEAVAPVEGRVQRRALWTILETMLNDQRQAWDMDGEGRYTQRVPGPGQEGTGTHGVLMALARGSAPAAVPVPSVVGSQ